MVCTCSFEGILGASSQKMMLSMHHARARPAVCPAAALCRPQRPIGAPSRNKPAMGRSSCSSRSLICCSAAGVGGNPAGELSAVQRTIEAWEEKLKGLPMGDPQLVAVMQNLVELRRIYIILLQQATGPAPAPAPAATVQASHTAFFQALCTAKEELLAEGDEAGPALLKLMADVIFPQLRSPEQTGQGILPTVLVRQCWKEFRDLILQQSRTLVIGTPGIGKSVFAWWFIRCLALLGYTVVFRMEKASESLLCKDGHVLAGNHDAFNYLRDETNTWWVYDAMEPDPLLIDISPNILVVSSPDRNQYKLFEKAPGVVKMVMPRWSLEEIKLGLQHVYPATKYPGMTAARVENLYNYYNGVPRYVLGKPSEISGPAADRMDLSAFSDAVHSCDAAQVLRGAVGYESVAEKYHCLLHLIATFPDFRQYRTEYSS